ncbi:MAG: tandem-95 repeat protein [Gammaproteobacteria bacterium]|nr:tandem-95 repeat protein [Gammaproteobacteria bacterium]
MKRSLHTPFLFYATLLVSVLLTACSSSDPSVGTLKNIPQNLAINPGTRVIELAWSGVSGANGYSVYWSNQADVSPARGALISTTEPHLEHRGLANGVRYYYVITAHTGQGESAESIVASATPEAAVPAKPSLVNARSGDARVTLQWEPLPGATHYTLYWNTQGNVSASDARIDEVISPFVHSGLSNNQDYYYILVAENAAGASSGSAEVSARPQKPAPSAPVIEQVNIDSGQATLRWSNIRNASNYTLYWNNRGEVSSNDVKITQVTSPYTLAPLDNNISYHYRVQAHNASGESRLSNAVELTPPDNYLITAPGTVPTEPVSLRVSLGSGQLSLDWPAVEGALGYHLYWSSSDSDDIFPGADGVETLAYIQPPYTHIGLNNGTTYRYRLSAFNDHGESDLSSEVSGSPDIIRPGVPAGLRAIAGDGTLGVRWNAVQGAIDYNLYVIDDQGNEQGILNIQSPYTLSGLINGQVYQLQVSARSAASDPNAQESARSSVIEIRPHQPVPNAPSLPSARPGNGYVEVQWQGASTQNPTDESQAVRGYRVYYHTRAGVSPRNGILLPASDIQAGDNGQWQITHRDVQNGRPYYYTITAVNDGGESRASAEVWARPQAPTPGVPSQVWTQEGDNQVRIYFEGIDSGEIAPTYNLYWTQERPADPVSVGDEFDDNGLDVSREVLVRSDTQVITNIQSGYVFSNGPDTNGFTYYFQVSAFNDSGESALSSQVSATPQVLPPQMAPQTVLAAPQPGGVNLDWAPVDSAIAYVIYWSTEPTIDSVTSARIVLSLDQVSAVREDGKLHYIHSGLANGLAYYYQLSAVNPGGESALSETISARPQVAPPVTPQTFSVISGDKQVVINWEQSGDATSYLLYWHSDNAAPLEQWSQQRGVQPGDVLGNFSNGQTYYFRLAALNPGGQSLLSGQRSVVPQALVPDSPTGFVAIAGDRQVVLNWHSQPGVSYTLYWSNSAEVAPINSEAPINDVLPSYVHTGLRNNITYYYQLSARNSSGESTASQIMTATPQQVVTDPENQAPQITQGATVNVTIDEDLKPTPFNLSLTASDVDGESFAWSLSQAPAQGSAGVLGNANASIVNIFYTPNLNYQGTDSFNIQVSDGRGGVDSITVNVTVIPQNDAPTISAQIPASLSATTGTALTLTLNNLVVTDPDNSYPEEFTLTVQAGRGYTLIGNTVTPIADIAVNGTISVPVSVSDGNAESNVFTISINVSNANIAPVAVDDRYTVAEGSTLRINAPGLLSNDIDADGNVLSVATAPITAPQHGSVSLSPDGAFNYTHNGSETTNDSFSYEISDGSASAIAVVSITVTPQNDPVSASNLNAPQAYREGDPAFNLTAIALSDPDSANVTATLTLSAPSAGSLVAVTVGNVTASYNASSGVWQASGVLADVNALLASLRFTPAPDFDQNFTIATSVDDGEAPAVTGSKRVTVTPVNDAPVITGQTPSPISLAAGNAFTIDFGHLLVTDVDNDYPSGYTLTVNPGPNYSVEGTTILPIQNHTGMLNVSVFVNDGNANSDPFNVAVNVLALNTPPTASIDTPSANRGVAVNTSFSFKGSATDVEDIPANLSYAWDFGSTAIPGSNLQNPIVTYPSLGVYTVTLTVTDTDGLAAKDVRTIDVVDAWGTPELIETLDDNKVAAPFGPRARAYAPQLAIDGANNVFVVWQQSWLGDGFNRTIANRYNAVNGGWEKAVPIDNSPSRNTYFPEVVVTPSGTAISVWRQWDGKKYDLWYNRYNVDLGWLTPRQTVERSENTIYSFNMAQDGAGNVRVVWEDASLTSSTARSIKGNLYNFNASTWGAEQSLEVSVGSSNKPKIAIGGVKNDAAIAIWSRAGTVRSNAVLGATTNWSSVFVETVDPKTFIGEREVGVFSSNDGLAVWARNGQIYWSFFDMQGIVPNRWSAVALISADIVAVSSKVSLTIDNSGRATVGFIGTHTDGRQGVWVSRLTDGWSTPDLISSTVLAGTAARDIVVAVDSVGNTLAVWNQGGDLWGNHSTVNANWSTPKLLETNAPILADSSPQVAFDANGVATVVWSQAVLAKMSDLTEQAVESIYASRLQYKVDARNAPQ